MQILMLLSTAAVAGLVSLVGLHLANRSARPTRRVHLGLWSLAVIPVSLTACTLSLFGRFSMGDALCGDCWRGPITSLVSLFVVATLALALVAGLLRVILLGYTLRRRLSPAPVHLQQCADGLAGRACARPVPVLLLGAEMPVAFTWGLLRPRLVLSTWMAENLDREELEAVLAHELAHAVGRDCRTIWLATLLRDATFYLPWAWRARRAVITGKELLADDAAVAATGHPVALASAIAKVWQRSLLGPPFPAGTALQLSEAGSGLQTRIERLLGPEAAGSEPATGPSRRGFAAGWLAPISPAQLLVYFSLALVAVCSLV